MRKSLWLAAAGIVLFISTIFVGAKLVDANPTDTRGKLTFGHDFIGFHTAGRAIYEGRWQDVYRPDIELANGRATLRANAVDFTMPYSGWLYPPFVAPFYAPFAAFEYRTSVWMWTAFSVACAGVASLLLIRLTNLAGGWKSWALVPVALSISMPFILTVGHAQNACLSLLILTAAVTLWRADRLILAGFVASLLAYKPQLGAMVAVAMVLISGARPLVGLLIGGTMLAGASELTMPGSIGTFLLRLPENVEAMRTSGLFPWHRHATPSAFFHRLLDGAPLAAWLTRGIACVFAFALILALLRFRGVDLPRIWRSPARRRHSDVLENISTSPGECHLATRARLDRIIAAGIASIPMLMPYYVDYDLILLAVPLALYAGDARDRFISTAWCIWFGGLYVGTGLAGATSFNLNVLTTGLIASMLLARALRDGAIATPEVAEPRDELLHTARRAA